MPFLTDRHYLAVFFSGESSSTAVLSAANPAATTAFLATFLVFLATVLRPNRVRFFDFLAWLLFDLARERFEADLDFVRLADFFILSSGVGCGLGSRLPTNRLQPI